MTNDTHLELPPPEAAGDARQPPSGGTGGARPPLRRFDGILGGVANGLAGYFGMETWLIRLAFVILSFFGGLGVVLYLAGWLLIPADGVDESIGERWLEEAKAGSKLGIFLIAIALIVLLISLDISGNGFAWAVALLVLGVLLYRGETPPVPVDTDQGPRDAPPFPAASVAGGPVARTNRPPRQPRARRVSPPSRLGRYTMAAILIGVGILALLDNAGVLSPDARHYLALAVAVVGAGLLIGSIWGRSRLMIVTGLLLAFMMGIAAIGNAVDAFTDEIRTFAPTTVEDISRTYSMESGTLIVDLTGVDWHEQEITIDADLGAGQLEIRLPADVSVAVNARAGVGQVEVFGRSSEGLGVGRSVTIAGVEGAGDITVTARVGAGQIIVTQENNS
ncbi:MAG: PspC domain-containing protein [Acidimicrobiia bacterium]|nr:PspC domain-containing protein [Acidimicrobiia bacterium]